MGAHNFNFARKIPQMEIYKPKYCIFGRKFSDRLKFSEVGVIAPLPPATTPQRQNSRKRERDVTRLKRSFQPTQRTQRNERKQRKKRNERNSRKKSRLQPIGTELSSPAKLKFLRFKLF